MKKRITDEIEYHIKEQNACFGGSSVVYEGWKLQDIGEMISTFFSEWLEFLDLQLCPVQASQNVKLHDVRAKVA